MLSTTGPLRDNQPANPRTFSEQMGQPVARTGHDMMDALYALAIEESREGPSKILRPSRFVHEIEHAPAVFERWEIEEVPRDDA